MRKKRDQIANLSAFLIAANKTMGEHNLKVNKWFTCISVFFSFFFYFSLDVFYWKGAEVASWHIISIRTQTRTWTQSWDCLTRTCNLEIWTSTHNWNFVTWNWGLRTWIHVLYEWPYGWLDLDRKTEIG